MTDPDDDQQRKWEERERGLAEVRRMLAEALVAHEMSDQESQEALLNIDLEKIVEDEHERLKERLKTCRTKTRSASRHSATSPNGSTKDLTTVTSRRASARGHRRWGEICPSCGTNLAGRSDGCPCQGHTPTQARQPTTEPADPADAPNPRWPN